MEHRGIDQDGRLILAASRELGEYLASGVTLWRLKGIDLPLCPGNLLLAQQRITSTADVELNQALQQIQLNVSRQLSAWRKKAAAELAIRLSQWKSVLDDIQENGQPDASYRYNVRIRVIIDLLIEVIGGLDVPFELRLTQLDEHLKLLTNPGPFIWDDEMKDKFPQEKNSYLYIRLKGERK
jgi:hypothetical protein